MAPTPPSLGRPQVSVVTAETSKKLRQAKIYCPRFTLDQLLHHFISFYAASEALVAGQPTDGTDTGYRTPPNRRDSAAAQADLDTPNASGSDRRTWSTATSTVGLEGPSDESSGANTEATEAEDEKTLELLSNLGGSESVTNASTMSFRENAFGAQSVWVLRSLDMIPIHLLFLDDNSFALHSSGQSDQVVRYGISLFETLYADACVSGGPTNRFSHDNHDSFWTVKANSISGYPQPYTQDLYVLIVQLQYIQTIIRDTLTTLLWMGESVNPISDLVADAMQHGFNDFTFAAIWRFLQFRTICRTICTQTLALRLGAWSGEGNSEEDALHSYFSHILRAENGSLFAAFITAMSNKADEYLSRFSCFPDELDLLLPEFSRRLRQIPHEVRTAGKYIYSKLGLRTFWQVLREASAKSKFGKMTEGSSSKRGVVDVDEECEARLISFYSSPIVKAVFADMVQFWGTASLFQIYHNGTSKRMFHPVVLCYAAAIVDCALAAIAQEEHGAMPAEEQSSQSSMYAVLNVAIKAHKSLLVSLGRKSARLPHSSPLYALLKGLKLNLTVNNPAAAATYFCPIKPHPPMTDLTREEVTSLLEELRDLKVV